VVGAVIYLLGILLSACASVALMGLIVGLWVIGSALADVREARRKRADERAVLEAIGTIGEKPR
jgi:hypothetical protein